MNETAPADGVGPANSERARATVHRWLGPLLAVPTPVIFVAAAALAVLFLWRGGRLDEVEASVRTASPGAALAILLVYATSIMILGLRWHILVRMAHGAPAWTSSAEVFLTSVIVNYAAPIGLAVPTRAALTVRDLGLSSRQSGAVVAWEAALDVAALAAISVAWLAAGGAVLVQMVAVDARMVAIAAAVIAVGIAVTGILARNAAVRSRAAPIFGRMLSGPVQHPALAILALSLTAAFWAMQMGVMAGLLGIFGVPVSPSLMLGLMGLPVLIGMLSPVPGGAGVREALMAAVARLDGVAAGPVVLAAVAYRLALFAVTPVVWGVVRLARARAKDR
ncbi:MAG: lysylphosphatidylglycerol synthase transmembrane domain-containing protein [Thermomicrobiales bacterium]